MSVSPAMDETTPKSCAADNARSWPVGGMCSGNDCTQPTGSAILANLTASTSRVRVTLFRRPLLPSAADGLGRNARQMEWRHRSRALRKAQQRNNVLRDEPR
jgi:hypothetical protein